MGKKLKAKNIETKGEKLVQMSSNRTLKNVAKDVVITIIALSNYEHDVSVPKDNIKVKLVDYYKISVQALFLVKEYT